MPTPTDFIQSRFTEPKPPEFIMEFTVETLNAFLTEYENWKVEKQAEINKHELSIDLITEVVCKYFNIPVSNINEKSRKRESYLEPRQWVHYLCKQLLKVSLDKIGIGTGGFNHATILNSYHTITNLIETDKGAKQHYCNLCKLINIASEKKIPIPLPVIEPHPAFKPTPSTPDCITHEAYMAHAPQGTRYLKYATI